jgi:hypothetical protein
MKNGGMSAFDIEGYFDEMLALPDIHAKKPDGIRLFRVSFATSLARQL